MVGGNWPVIKKMVGQAGQWLGAAGLADRPRHRPKALMISEELESHLVVPWTLDPYSQPETGKKRHSTVPDFSHPLGSL